MCPFSANAQEFNNWAIDIYGGYYMGASLDDTPCSAELCNKKGGEQSMFPLYGIFASAELATDLKATMTYYNDQTDTPLRLLALSYNVSDHLYVEAGRLGVPFGFDAPNLDTFAPPAHMPFTTPFVFRGIRAGIGTPDYGLRVGFIDKGFDLSVAYHDPVDTAQQDQQKHNRAVNGFDDIEGNIDSDGNSGEISEGLRQLGIFGILQALPGPTAEDEPVIVLIPDRQDMTTIHASNTTTSYRISFDAIHTEYDFGQNTTFGIIDFTSFQYDTTIGAQMFTMLNDGAVSARGFAINFIHHYKNFDLFHNHGVFKLKHVEFEALEHTVGIVYEIKQFKHGSVFIRPAVHRIEKGGAFLSFENDQTTFMTLTTGFTF